MEPFRTLTGVAAPLPLANVDTDLIIPKQFLKTVARTGLGKGLFNDLRFDESGAEKPDFVLNKPAYRKASVLIAGANFGCGSSREHAPWALLDFGIRCVIAPSFADIFYGNCFKNGILPLALPQATIDLLLEDADKGANATLTVDLERKVVVRPDGAEIAFDLDEGLRQKLLRGLDEIGETLAHAPAIDGFEDTRRQQFPWL